MSAVDRRQFLRQAGTTAFAQLPASRCWPLVWPRPFRPTRRSWWASWAFRATAPSLAVGFATRPDCEVAYLADVDTTLFGKVGPGYVDMLPPELRGSRLEGVVKAQGKAPKTVQDFRRVLDDKSVDAIVIATPDHWHAPATVWACQAGKDVYVEKPISHSPWEGRQMVEAARKYRRIVQVGTQTRMPPYLPGAKYIAPGKLGKIHFCRVLNMKPLVNFPWAPPGRRPPGSIGTCGGPRPRARTMSTHRDMASLLALFGRRHHQRRRPPVDIARSCAGSNIRAFYSRRSL